jgi:hypothetical protein
MWEENLMKPIKKGEEKETKKKGGNEPNRKKDTWTKEIIII